MIYDTDAFGTFQEKIDEIRRSKPARHIRNARREMLLAAKAVIEGCLEKLDSAEEQLDKEPEPVRKVEIQEG